MNRHDADSSIDHHTAARNPKLRPTRAEALRVADDLLRRLAEWDMLYVAPDGKPVTADGPYWQSEIARTRAYIAEARP